MRFSLRDKFNIFIIIHVCIHVYLPNLNKFHYMLHLFQGLLLPLVLLVLYILRVILKTHLLAFFLKSQVCLLWFSLC